jgi:hypothetical protein
VVDEVVVVFVGVVGVVTGNGCTLGGVARMLGVTEKAGRATGVLATVGLGVEIEGLMVLTTGFGTTGRWAVTATGTGVMRVVVPAFGLTAAMVAVGRGANGVLTTGVGIGLVVTGLEVTGVTGAGVKTGAGVNPCPLPVLVNAVALFCASGTNGLMIFGATGFGAGFTVGLAVGLAAGLVVVAAGLAGLLAITGIVAVSRPSVFVVAGAVALGVVVSGVVAAVVLGEVVFGVAGVWATIGSGGGGGLLLFNAHRPTPPKSNAKAPPNKTGVETLGAPAAFLLGGAV